uniref:Uncharacterized protein n=1 Tax=Arundo donax TaxID=35708 RepID=A0A0A8ZA28_ARUDO
MHHHHKIMMSFWQENLKCWWNSYGQIDDDDMHRLI